MARLTITTNDGLLERLSQSAKRKLTKNEIDKQRISFIYAGMPKLSDMSKAEIEDTLSKAS